MKRLVAIITLFFAALFSAPMASASTATVSVLDPDDVLTPQDESRLADAVERSGLDPSITAVDFLITRTASRPYNDWVVDKAKSDYPQLLASDQDHFAPGHLIFGLATESRDMGVYVGEDVADAIYFDKNYDRILDSMKPKFADGEWVTGFEIGLETVAHPKQPKESGPTPAWVWAILGGSAVLGAGGIWAGVNSQRKKKAAEIRKDYDYISQNYGRVASSLEQINSRAHNLNSPIANAQLRDQWDSIYNGFLGIHGEMMKLPDLNGASDKELLKYKHEVQEIRAQSKKVVNAEKNIEKLEEMERGDSSRRIKEVSRINEDLRRARASAKKADHQQMLAELITRAEQLEANPTSPAFMDSYARLIRDSQVTIKAVADTDYKKAGLGKNQPPTLGDSNWHPGYGYNNYVPFYLVYSWHNSAVSAESSSSSSTSFSGGFSGTGASSSF